jgi:hypothetical protein
MFLLKADGQGTGGMEEKIEQDKPEAEPQNDQRKGPITPRDREK